MKNVFSENLKAARKLKGWTQDQAAKAIRVKRSRYGAWEEDRSKPRQEILLKICNVFQIEDLISFLTTPLAKNHSSQ